MISGGDQATCEGPVGHTITAERLVFNVQLGHVTKRGRKHPAHRNCKVHFPIIKEITSVIPGEPIKGSLNWKDKRVPIPPGAVSKVINLDLFNGRSHIIDQRHRSPLGIVNVVDQGDAIIFSPKPPSDF